MKGLIWISLLFVFETHTALASPEPVNPSAVFEQANEAYQRGDYSEAISLYESLVKQGSVNAPVFYNLGNAYYKEKRIGPAILHYEKARQLSPRDRDILANLQYMRGLLEYRVEDKRNWYLRKGEGLLQTFARKEIAWITLILGVFFWVSWAFLLFLRPYSKWGWRRKTFLFLLLGFSGLWVVRTGYDLRVKEAIVLKDQASVRYGPSFKDQVAFRLGEGMKVRIKKRADEWSRIVLPNAETGWILQEEIGEI